jgi:hypothetical protein
MSGPDVGAQVQLVAFAEGNVKRELYVTMDERMEVLKKWLDNDLKK